MAAVTASSPPSWAAMVPSPSHRKRHQHQRSRSMAVDLSSSLSSRPPVSREDDSRASNTANHNSRASVSSSTSTARRPRHQRSTEDGSHSSRKSSSRTPSASSMVLTPGPYDPDFEAAFTPSGTDGDSDDNDAASTSAATLRPPYVSSARRSMRMGLNRPVTPAALTASCPPDCRCSDRDIRLGRCSRGLARVTTSPSSDDDSDAEARAIAVPGAHGIQSQENTPLARSSLRGSKSGDFRSSLGSASSDLLRKPVAHIIDSSSESEDTQGRQHNENDSQSTLRTALARHSSYHRHRSSRSGDHSLGGASDARSTTSEEHKRRRREERDRLIRQRIEKKRLARTSSAAEAAPARDSTHELMPTSETSFGGFHQRERSFNEDLGRLHRISHPPSATSIASFAAHVSPSKSEARRAALQKALQSSQSSQGQQLDVDASAGRSKHTSSPRSSSLALDLPPLPASADGEDRSSTSILQEGIRLMNNEQLANRRESSRIEMQEEERAQSTQDHLPPPGGGSLLSSQDPAPSPTGFSFTPQRMLKTASPSPSSSSSNGESPRRAAHRRSRGTSGVVSLNARLPPADSSEARRRLAEVLRSPNLDVLPAQSFDADPATSADKLQQATIEHDALADDGNSSSSVTNHEGPKRNRKSVRFSPTMEYVEPSGDGEPFSSDEEDACAVGNGGDERGADHNKTQAESGHRPSAVSEGITQINLDEALEKLESKEEEVIGFKATMDASEAAYASEISTPHRHRTGTFRSPPSTFGKVRNAEGEDSSTAATERSFAKHVLRRIPQTNAGLHGDVSTPNRSAASSVGGTPMMPGGLRLSPAFKNQKVANSLLKGPSSPPLRKPRGLHGDRGLPPSYSAVTSGNSGHTSMSLSASIDSSLGVVGEEAEELEDGEQQLAAASTAGSDTQTASSDVEPGDESIWHDDNDDSEQESPNFQPPRESTPPPSGHSSRGDHSRSDGVNQSHAPLTNETLLAGSVNASLLSGLKAIDSAPPSPTGLIPENQLREGEEPEVTDTPSEQSPSECAEFLGDDSLRMTLEKVVEVLKGRMQTRQESRAVAEAVAQAPNHTSATLPPHGVPRSSSEGRTHEDVELKDVLYLKLRELEAEEERFESVQAQWGETDMQQLSRLQATRQILQSGIDFLNNGSLLPRGHTLHTTPWLLSRRVRAATSLALVQAFLLWLLLIAIRHGSEHLYRSIYRDPFYPHIYDATSVRTDAALLSQISSETMAPLGMLRASSSFDSSASRPIAWLLDLTWIPRLTVARPLPGSVADWAAALQYLKLIPSAVVRALIAALIDADHDPTQRATSGDVALSHSQRVHTSTPM